MSKKKYRLTAKSFYIKTDGVSKCHQEGDLVELSDNQYKAFDDRFEPADARQQEAELEKKANADSEKQAKAEAGARKAPAKVEAEARKAPAKTEAKKPYPKAEDKAEDK